MKPNQVGSLVLWPKMNSRYDMNQMNSNTIPCARKLSVVWGSRGSILKTINVNFHFKSLTHWESQMVGTLFKGSKHLQIEQFSIIKKVLMWATMWWACIAKTYLMIWRIVMELESCDSCSFAHLECDLTNSMMSN
jgi:hypothetical protein